MRFFIVGLAVLMLAGCASAPQPKVVNSPVNFANELSAVSDRASLASMRRTLTEDVRENWLRYQHYRCEEIYRDQMSRRCFQNEARVLALFMILPVEELSEDQLAMSIELYDYYRNLQASAHQASPNSEAHVALMGVDGHQATPANSQFETMALTRTASPLALFVVSVREVLTTGDNTVY